MSLVVDNIAVALQQRLFPTVTVWNRLEGRPRTLKFDRALCAEVRDALWMITRQWQMGEFRGDDAGSPVEAKLHMATTRLTKYRPGSAGAEHFDNDVPLEAKVERRAIPLALGDRKMSLDLRLMMGRHWLKLIRGIGDYRQDFIDKYGVTAPDPSVKEDADRAAHLEVWQRFAAAAGRAMDGIELYLHLKANPANHPYDGIAVSNADKPALDARAGRFVAFFDRLFYQPPVAGNDAWIPDRLEYQFACSAPDAVGERTYVAEEYYHGHLDWYNVDLDRGSGGLGDVDGPPPAGVPSSETRTLIPAPIAFEGMPNTRWWTFEDRKTNFGDIDAATTDLAKLLFVEFGLVYANDWFVIPCTLPAGAIATVRGLAVTNVFGERFWIEAAGSGADDNWQRWSMFTVNVKGRAGEAADPSLLLLPTVPKIQESAPIEEVLLIRDEMANMVWGIENKVPLPSGGAKPGAEAATETLAFFKRGVIPPPPVEYKANIRYRVVNTVPENWIPFLPVHLPDDVREIQLQRASMPRIIEGDPNPPPKVRPRTVLMREGLDRLPQSPYFLHEEEVPRAGVRVTQAFQRTRWRNGRVFLWLGVRKQTGRGGGSSGLAFDQIVDVKRAT